MGTCVSPCLQHAECGVGVIPPDHQVVTQPPGAAHHQGLTPVHFSAQHKRFLWDKGVHVGVIYEVFKAWYGDEGVFKV